MSGFWKFTSSYASKVSKILENEDIILEDLLDERETVSELLASNSKLIEYLRRPEVLEKLIDTTFPTLPCVLKSFSKLTVKSNFYRLGRSGIHKFCS